MFGNNITLPFLKTTKVPPKIIDSRTSPDIIVKEGSSVNLTCDALGSPEPRIMWKREDNQMIKYDAGEGN